MRRLLVIVPAVFILIFAAIGFQQFYDPGSDQFGASTANTSEQIARGAYLVRAGDCMACHTARGGKPYAGGRAIPTPYGNIFSPNITPDVTTGIGKWTADDFWRALHDGKSKDGKFLYPAFPFLNYTLVTREDSDAIFAYLTSLGSVNQPNHEHDLRFPYNQRILLAGWRALYFKPGTYRPDQTKSIEWNRGAYLVQGLGHCSACHTGRTVFGASEIKADLAGGLIPVLNWYAPSLTSDAEAGLGNWDDRHIVDLLKKGVSEKGIVFGPMAEVVDRSLQHLSDGDIKAMAGYLKSLPQTGESPGFENIVVEQDAETVMVRGAKLYEKHCAECHQANGQGHAAIYPPLAGNRALTMHSAVNPIRMVLNGGYPPSTSGNPRPYGMPPFGQVLNDNEVAAVVSYLRNSWGNRAALVSAIEVSKNRGAPLD